MTINYNAVADRSVTSLPFSYLKTLVLLLSLCLGFVATAQDDTYEGGNLDEVTVTEEEARSLIKQLIDVDRFLHSFGVQKIAKDEELVAYAEGFVERNNIEVLTIGYIDSEEFWPRIFKNIRLKKIKKANTDLLLTGHILFIPIMETDGSISGYTVELKLEGKTTQVYELLEVSQTDIELIAEETTTEKLGDTPYATPEQAQREVADAMIAALQKVEGKGSPEGGAGKLVSFKPFPNQNYGFDLQSYSQIASDYPTITVGGRTVPTAWKSLKANSPDQVIAIDTSDQTLTFELNGAPVTGTKSDSAYQLTINGGSNESEGELVAKLGNTIVGQLNTISFNEVNTNVKIVPINNVIDPSSLLTIQNQLNEIYKSAVTTWTVEVMDNQNISGWDTNGTPGMQDTGIDGAASYSDEMKSFIKEFKRNNDRDKKAYYIFLVDRAETANKRGYMPRTKQWGFIFVNASGHSTDNIPKTIAHELGHGVFHLAHTFSNPGLPENNTDNLMDYRGGTSLYKYQWEKIHNPDIVFAMFDDEEDASYAPWTALDNGFIVNRIPGISDDEIVSFISPTGYIYSLPGRVRDLTFLESKGYLIAFTLDKERYIALRKRSNGIEDFYGYRYDLEKKPDGTYEAGNHKGYSDDLSASITEPQVYYIKNLASADCGTAKLYLAPYIGKQANLDDQYGYQEGDRNIKYDTDITSFATHSNATYQEVNSSFDCLSSEAKFLYKFAEYYFEEDEFEEEELLDIASRIDQYTVYFEGFHDQEISQSPYPLKIRDYGEIRRLNNFLKEKGAPEGSEKPVLLIKLVDADNDAYFVDALSALVPLTESIQGLFSCIENQNIQMDGYYVPLCFWMSSDVLVTNYYNLAGGDPPFMSGFADGAIGTVDGLKDLVVGVLALKAAWTIDLVKSSNDIADVIRPYGELADKANQLGTNIGVASVLVSSPTMMLDNSNLTQAARKMIIRELKAYQKIISEDVINEDNIQFTADLLNSLNSFLPEQVRLRKERVLNAMYLTDPTLLALDQLNTSEEAAAIRKQTLEVLDFAVQFTDLESADFRDEAIDQIITEIKSYLDEIDNVSSNQARYQHGKIGFEVAMEVAGIALTGGSANIATGLKRFTKAASEGTDLIKTFSRTFAKRLGKNVDDLFDFIPDNLSKIRKIVDEAPDNQSLANRLRSLISEDGNSSLLNKLDEAITKYPSLEDELLTNLDLIDEFKFVNSKWEGKYASKMKFIDGKLSDAPSFQKVLDDQIPTLKNGNQPQSIQDLGRVFDQEYAIEAENAFRNNDFSKLPHLESYYKDGYQIVSGQVRIKSGVNISTSVEVRPDVLLFKTNSSGQIVKSSSIWKECKIRLSSPPTSNQSTIFELFTNNTIARNQLEFEVLSDNTVLTNLGLSKGSTMGFEKINQVSIDNGAIKILTIY